MNIYIDEAGIFANPRRLDSCPSVVGAIVIPTSSHAELLDRFDSLKSLWGHAATEVKGSALDEVQVAQALCLLRSS